MTMGSFWNLPDEITSDILSRLPAKSVGICRCVWKPWRALLSRPQFIRAHLRMSRIAGRNSLTFWDFPRCFLSVSLSNAHKVFDKITLLQHQPICASNGLPVGLVSDSCDGLLLVFVNDDLDDDNDDEDKSCKRLVLNPITRESIQVPDPPFCLSESKDCHTFIKFGYHPADNDYKVLSISFYDNEDGNGITPDYNAELVVDVYSLKTGCWKRAQTSHYYDSYQDMQGAPHLVHGCLNWTARRTVDGELVIVGFHLVDEKFFEVPPPPHAVDDDCELVVFGKCLCMFQKTGSDLWMMKEYGVKESWTKFMINYPDGSCGNARYMVSVDEEDVVFVYKEMSVMYNLKQGSFKYLEIPG